MKQSQLFGKTLREPPKEEVSVNARLLEQAGYVEKLMSGVYSYLPLGWRVYKKIEQIIREEMNAIGGQELRLPSLHPKKNWEETGRWETMDDLYKLTDKSDREFALAGTHEEVITPLARRDISSYRDLPLAVYQFQNKFRMELRAKSGILRGREFIMKDLYSFHSSAEDFSEYYEKVKEAYKRIFDRVGIGEKTVLTFASGGSFSEYSHEFQALTPAGEDTIYFCKKCKVAVNDEIMDKQKKCPECGQEKKNLEIHKAIEVGNIFPLKNKFSSAFKLTYKDEEGIDRPVFMGCYGIGLGRLIGSIVEIHHDDKGIIWPVKVAPFVIHLVRIGEDDEIKATADKLYDDLRKKDVEVLYDDRDESAGVKLNDADLMGLPARVVISKKTVQEGVYEWKPRMGGKIKNIKDVYAELQSIWI